ncbi:hypothetical protein [Nakamurella lactea]|uniref:hypothetical protein n=1 Tax=Nakamurella lactea TaxID=459515 RepID=UPI000491D775|nr:hypothetical protein [Nakamurella lactea]
MLVLIGAVLGPVALVANWARTVVTDDDAYVRAVAPLATDPEVIAALQDRLVTAVMTAVDNLGASDQVAEFLSARDVPDRVTDAVIAALDALNGGIRDLVGRVVGDVLTAPGFATVWEQLNRTAHHQFVQLMNGQGNLLDPAGNIALQLEPVLAQVRERLVAQGHSWAAGIPTGSAEYVLIPAADVATLRAHYAQLIRWSTAVSAGALCALIGAVVMAADRRRGAAHASAALACGTVVVGVLLRFALTAVSKPARSPEATHAILAVVTADLVAWIRLVAMVSLTVAALAALWAPGQRRALPVPVPVPSSGRRRPARPEFSLPGGDARIGPGGSRSAPDPKHRS